MALVFGFTDIGASVPKYDAYDKVTGRARYVEDYPSHGMLHARTIRSTIARGRILGITYDPAFDWSGFTIVDHRDIRTSRLRQHVQRHSDFHGGFLPVHIPIGIYIYS